VFGLFHYAKSKIRSEWQRTATCKAMSVDAIVTIVVGVLGLSGWALYQKERAKSRDYATDLSQLIHDYDLTKDDLRRSLKHEEIKERVGR